MIFTKAFWQDTAERSISSAAQGAVTGWGLATFTDVGQVASTAQTAGLAALSLGVLTFLKCVAASQVGSKQPPTPSFVDTTPAPAPTPEPTPGGTP